MAAGVGAAFSAGLFPAAKAARAPAAPAVNAPAVNAPVVNAAASTPAEAAAAQGKSLSVALITGGGTGIGRAVALRLAAGGWQREAGAQVAIVLTGRRAEVLEETAQEIRKAHGEGVHVLVHAAYLTLAADVKGLFNAVASNFGRLDLLFNNAGANVPPTTFDKMEYDDWRRVININLDAAFHVARDAYRMMRDQTPQGGRIINNGSISATTPRPAASAYTASKHAITGLTKSIALDGRAHQVACGQIDFGNVVSAISAGMAVGMPQADGSIRAEPRMSQTDAADAVFYMAQLPLTANVLQMTVMATNMPFVGRG
jgi:NAD(P)-dependent dehydrogenase (short-subunit alcohol dehydrogenase family)